MGEQIDMWQLLGMTAHDLAEGLRSPEAKEKSAPAETGAKSQAGSFDFTSSLSATVQGGKEKDVSGRFGGRPNEGTLPNAGQAATKHKGKARIAPAKYGNRHVLLVPRFRS